MSLLDALLTESYRDPRQVHIALRTDGQLGSGSAADPYDGGTRLGPAFRASLTCNRLEFVVRTPSPHGLSPGATIENILGAQGLAAGSFNISTATVKEVVSPIHFTLLASSLPAAPPDVQFWYKGPITAEIPGFSGRVSIQIYWPVAKVSTNQAHGPATYGAVRVDGIGSPYAGDQIALGDPTRANFWYRLAGLPTADLLSGLDCSVTPIIHRFDEVMRSVPEYSVIRVGPGTFETRGTASIYVVGDDFSVVHVGFVMRAGYRLLGSGLGVTTVKLVMPIDEITQTMAIGFNTRPTTEYAEVADLTVDCNGPGHVAPYGTFPAPYTCGAVVLGGSFCRIRRVRAINFCTQGAAEGFPLGIDQAGAGNPAIKFPIIEDCILEKPGENNTHETTLTAIIGDVVAATAVSPITRHNYQNCEYSNGLSPELLGVAGLTVTAGVATLTTKRPHNRLVGQNVLIQNVLIPNSDVRHRLNDTFKITAVTSPTVLEFAFTSDPGSFDYTQASVGPEFFGRGALSGTGCVNEGNALHNCTKGCYQDTGSTRDVVFRDNYFSNITTGLDFNFDPVGAVEAARFARSGVDLASLAHSGTTATAQSADSHKLVEGETVNISGALIDEGNEPPEGSYNGNYAIHIVNDTTFSYTMLNDPGAQADEPTLEDPIRVGIYCLKRDTTNPKVAILQTAQPHRFRVGEALTVFNVFKGGQLVPFGESYADTVIVLEVLSETAFSYAMKNDPGGVADAATAIRKISLQARWQVRRISYENNVCDLYRFDSTTGVVPKGVSTFGYEQGPPFMFPQAVIRENIFRLEDYPSELSSPGGPHHGLRLDSCESVLIEGNTIDSQDANPIHYLHSRGVRAFNNQTSAGSALPLSEDVGNDPFSGRDTLEDRIQDAIALSLL